MEKKVRIGIDGRELKKGELTGTGRVLLNFLNHAPKIKLDWEFILFVNQHSAIDLEYPNLKKIPVHEGLTWWWDQVQLPQYLRDEKIDLFFSPYYKAPLFTPCPTIITLLDLLFLIIPSYRRPNRFLYNFYLRVFGRAVAKRTNAIITSSDYSKKDIVHIFKVPAQKVKVVPLWAEERFRPLHNLPLMENIKKKYGISKNYILYVGNFRPHKNIPGLLKAYSLLPEKIREEYQLVLAGQKDSYFPSLIKLAGSLKITDCLIFTDFIIDEDLPALYNGSEIFVIPSFYEGFGLPPLEAMACGIPVIASNVSSLPEVVGDAGILIDPKDIYGLSRVMEELLTDVELRSKMRERGLRRAELFQAEEATCKILNAFDEIMGQINEKFLKEIKKILIINFGGMGDLLLSFPALKALRNLCPQAEICMLISSRVTEIAEDLSWLDRVFALDVRFKRGIPFSKVLKSFNVLMALRRKRFDVAINMRTIGSKRSAKKIKFLLDFINPEVRAGRNTEGRGYFFDIKIPEADPGDRFELEYDIDTVRALGVDAVDKSIDFAIDNKSNERINKILREEGVDARDVLICIHPGGKPVRRWPLENFSEVISEINKRISCKFIITGGKNETALSEKIINTTNAKIIDITGRLNLKELGPFIKRCDLCISNDTGPMHIAAILKTPLVAIFGSGPLKRYDPRYISDKAVVLYKKVECAPCEKIKCKSLKCLKTISPGEVTQAALRLIQQNR